MDTQSSSMSARRGTPGLDIFKIAGRSISGFLPSFKTGDVRQVRQPFTSQLEERLALYLEYHPHVRSYQRGDASEAFARARHLHTPLGTPYRIPYLYDGKAHDYLPDFVGTLCDDGLLIAEAGRDSEKRKAQPMAKAEAAQRVAHLSHGVYWIGTEENLSVRRHYNLLYLHARRQSFPTYQEIAAELLAHWPWGEMGSVNEFVRIFGSRWSDHEVEAAVWKLVGDAAAQGRFLVDLSEVELSLLTPLALLDPSLPPILPDPLPGSLESPVDESQPLRPFEPRDEMLREWQGLVPGPTFDAATLEDAELRARFHRNLAAVTAVLAGQPRRQVAQTYGMHPFALARLVQRVQQFGQIACVPHATYHRERVLRPEFQQVLRKLYTHPIRPTMMAVYEDVRLQQLADALSEQEKMRIPTPTYKQVRSFLKGIAQEADVQSARSGLKHPPPERMSPSSFVLSVPYPASICQVDEHTLDLLVVTPGGTVITRRAHAAVLICVKTAAILGAVLALDALREEDYMRLVKQALEPKDRFTTLYECQHPWPCFGKPTIIFHDRGEIFTRRSSDTSPG
jgi:transposase